MTRLDIALFNFRDGGLQPDGSYDFEPLAAAFADGPVPDVIMLCEAKFWHARGRQPFHTAINALRIATGRLYVGELFTGPLGTAVIYDPAVLCLDATEEPAFPDKCNLARFHLCARPDYRLQIFVEHWSYADSEQRLARARVLATVGAGPVPTVIAGDLNCTASGPHLPATDWTSVPIGVRDHKGRQDDAGNWVADTRALDRLIGHWNDATGERTDSAGFFHVAELDPDAPRPLPPTVNAGSGLHIDYILINAALRSSADVVPGSYQVHVPPGTDPAAWPSDHRRVSVGLRVHAGARPGESPSDAAENGQ